MAVQKLLQKVDDLIFFVKESREYQLCLKAKEKMRENEELMQLIEEVKSL